MLKPYIIYYQWADVPSHSDNDTLSIRELIYGVCFSMQIYIKQSLLKKIRVSIIFILNTKQNRNYML